MRNISRIKLILIIVTMMISVVIPNVHASTWPKSSVDGDVAYTIEGFEIRLYDASTDEEGNAKLELENFSNRTPVHTIPLNPTAYTINEEYKTDKLGSAPARFVDLNLSTTKEEIEQLIKEKIPTLATENEAYYGELVVNYRFTALPQEYTHYYNVNFFEAFLATAKNPEYKLPQIALNTPVSQVINIVAYAKQEGEDVIAYETELTEDSPLANYVTNFALLSTKEYDLTNYESETAEGKFVYMFHNIDNIDYLIDGLRIEEDTPEDNIPEVTPPEDIIDEITTPSTPENTQKDQVVEVENTSSSISGIIYFISIIIVAVGGTIIYKETKAKEIES